MRGSLHPETDENLGRTPLFLWRSFETTSQTPSLFLHIKPSWIHCLRNWGQPQLHLLWGPSDKRAVLN